MSLLPPRKPELCHFSSPQEVVRHIEILNKYKQLPRCLDAIEEAISLFPTYAQSFLVLGWNLIVNAEDQSRYNLYQARIFDFGIKPSDKVLDIGSGHIPFPLATHLADISLSDGSIGRNGVAFKYVKGKPVYECCVEKTPFADKEFDFVYCSHVLEHSEDPESACKELMRIAKRGYIETPTKGKDIFMVTAELSNHRSHVELFHEVLTFIKYHEWEIPGLHYNILMQMHVSPINDREKAFSALLYLFPRVINTMMLWENEFQFKIYD